MMEAKDQQFIDMWIEAQDQFEKATKKPLKTAPNRDLDVFLNRIEDQFNSQYPENNGKKAEKKARMKQLVTSMVYIVRLFGGIAAQAASAVFGPANLCFNALSFLMEIPEKIFQFYEDLAKLFEEITTFMLQFQIYQRIEQYKEVGKEFKLCTHRIMVAFVDICATSISILDSSKAGTLKQWAEISLFDKKSKIHEKMLNFKDLIGQQGQVSEAVTLELIVKHDADVLKRLSIASQESLRQLQLLQADYEMGKDTNKDVKEIKETLNNVIEKTSEKDRRAEFDSICKELSTPQITIKVESLPSFDQDNRQGLLPGSGSWIEEIEAYKLWANIEFDCSSPLVLCGESGSGKSSLAYVVCKKLQSCLYIKENTVTHIPIAYFDFDIFKKDKKSSSSLTGETVRAAVKSMAAQIGRPSNIPFFNKLSTALKDASWMRDANVDTLLTKLLPFSRSKDTPSMRFVLCFDSLDVLDDEAVTDLVESVIKLPASRARIVLTGTPEKLKHLSKIVRGTNDLSILIRIDEQNRPDIERFIKHQLKKFKMLQDNSQESKTLYRDILEELLNNGKGNFNYIDQRIDAIKDAMEAESSRDEIDRVIRDGRRRDPTVIVKADLEDLNTSLKAQEIDQLNEILAWTIHAYEWMSVPQITAALFLRNKRVLYQSLKDKIVGKYSRILRIDSEEDGPPTVRTTNQDLLDYLAKSQRQQPLEQNQKGNTHPRITMRIEIEQATQTQTQRFLWDLTERSFMDKVPFIALNNESEASLHIRANKVDSHLLIVNRIFEILSEPPREETSTLSTYALWYLLDHLSELQDSKEELTLSERRDIVDAMVGLFRSSESLGQHLETDFLNQGLWLHGGLKTIQDWLLDSEAVDKLNSQAGAWCRRATADVLLPTFNLAIKIAHQWLRDRSREVKSPYSWLNIYVLRLREQNNCVDNCGMNAKSSTTSDRNEIQQNSVAFKEYADDEWVEEGETAGTRIEETAEWALRSAHLEKDFIYYERLGLTYQSYHDDNKSKEAFLKARGFSNSDWKINSHLAHTYARCDEIESALSEMEIALIGQTSQPELSEEQRKSIITNLIQQTTWYHKLGRNEEAIQKLKEAIQLDEHDYEAYFKLFRLYMDIGRTSEALDALQNMQDTPATKHKDLTKLSSALLEFDIWKVEREFVETLLQVSFPTVLLALQSASSFAQVTGMEREAVELHLIHGIALAHYDPDNTAKDLQLAATEWNKGVERGMNSSDWSIRDSAILCASYSINHYFSMAQSSRSTDLAKYESHAQQVEMLAKKVCYPGSKYRPLWSPLAFFYSIGGMEDKARDLIKISIVNGIGILSDNDPTNDLYGFSTIAKAFLHANDELNALSAYSLLGPIERYSTKGSEQEHLLSNDEVADEVHYDPKKVLPPDMYTFGCDGMSRSSCKSGSVI